MTMENRFTVKDAFLFALVVVAIALIGMSMKQYDRQWRQVQELGGKNDALTRDINNLRDLVQSIASRPPPNVTIQNVIPGVGAAPTTQQAHAAANLPANSAVVTVSEGDTDPAKSDNPFARLVGAREKADFAEGDWYIENIPARVGRLTPLVNEDVYGSTVRARVGETLLTREPDTLELKPLLAESYEIAPDGLTFTFKLRRGVSFSDGTPMTAKDVKFTFDWIMNPVVDAARQRAYFTDQGVTCETPDSYTVVFRLKKVYYQMLAILGVDMLIMPQHFVSKFSANEYNENPGILMGTGPWRLRDPAGWRPGQRIELVRNERYWGVKPAFNRIIYLEVEEEAPQSTMYQNGQIDWLPCTPEQYDNLKKDKKTLDRSQTLEYVSMLGGYNYIGWNQQRQNRPTYFADKRVRQAMTMLIDRERMAKELWRGYANVANGPFSSRGKQAAPDVTSWPYDVVRAKQFLAECGLSDKNGDGVLDGPDGKSFRFELMYPSKSDITQRTALILKDSLAAAGIMMELKPTDWPTMLELLKQSDFDACLLGWSSSVESDPYQIFHSSQQNDQGDNRTHYTNTELDKLIDQARVELNVDKRMQLWQAVARILHEDQPYTFLLERKALRFVDKRIRNIEYTRMGVNRMNMEVQPDPWYVPAAEQKYTE
jgi:peptide/nickel transport system substrate-binding protein